jgi:DNA-binding CsgD family transcriptional regulator
MTAFGPQGTAGLPGRDAALAALAAVVADARAGRRGVVLVTGDAGMGKTSLLRSAFGALDGTVLWASGAEGEAHVPHGITDQLIRSSPLGREDRDGLRASIGSDALAMGAAMVALVDRLDLGAAGPLIVVVDDAQWADHASLRALTFAARRLRRDRAALVVACRGDGVDALPEVLVRLVDDEGTRLAVEPLGREDVRRVAAEQLGHPVSATTAERLRAHTGGVPLHLRTLLEELPPGALTSDGALPAPRSFNTLVLSRLAGAGPDVEAVVMAAAILEDPATPATLGDVAGVVDVLPAVDDAVSRGLLTVLPTGRDLEVRVSVPHPLMRAALVGDLSHARKADLHQRAAATLTGLPALRHRLTAASGPDPILWADAMAAAADEGSRGHAETAALISQLAVRVAPDPDARLLSALDAIDHHLDAGQLDQAAGLREELATAPSEPRTRYIAGRLAYVLGPRREAGAHLQAAWDELVARAGSEDQLTDLDPDARRLAGAVAAALAVIAVDRADGEGGVRWARRAIDLDPREAARGSTAHLLAGASALSGRFEEGLAELEQIGAASGDEPGPVTADVLSGRGLLRLWCHDLTGAAGDFERSLEMGRHGSFVGRETARFYLAEVRYRQGWWDEAVALAETAASVIDDTEQAWMAAIPHATAARPLAARGSSSAAEHLERAEAAAAMVGGVSAVLAEVGALEVAASRHDHDQVVALGDGLAGRPIDERIAPWRASYVEALVVKGRLDDASAVVAELSAIPATPLVQADLARARTALAAAGSGVDLAALVDDAAELGDAAGPYPTARLELALGRALRRAGHRRAAADHLHRARARFDDLGALPWSEVAARELEMAGLRPRRSVPRAGAELTPSEQAVARLVARGLTNREVGEELIVSAKTVEHHLSRIYGKLGVRSRTELARIYAPDA